jgi:UDP-3-O-[3-hydroxymyristoyl] glucosamine N-acyltransferase
LKLKDIAASLGCELEGDGDLDIERVSGIGDAGPGDLTFFTNPKYAAELRATRASAVILGPGAGPAPCAVLRDPQPYLAFA